MQAKEKSREYWRGRNASARLGLEVLRFDETALQKRIELNARKVYKAPTHPFEEEIPFWTLSKEHLKSAKIKDKSFWFIDSLSTLDLMVDHLKQQKTIAIDLEFGDDYSFHKTTCLIQISSKTVDFVVDSILLYNYIPEALRDILINPLILKIFFDTPDILAFQRDFDLRVFPLIDFQNVYQHHKQLKEKPGFKYVVDNFLFDNVYEEDIVEVDKVSYHGFNWRLRPLPDGAIEYARKDSQLLLECWELYKLIYRTSIESADFNYSHHRKFMLKEFAFPVAQDYNYFFSNAWKHVGDTYQKKFVPSDVYLFKELHNWRYNTAKLRDNTCHNIFSDVDCLKLCIIKPADTMSLDKCSFKCSLLDQVAKDSIIGIICRLTEKQVLSDPVISDIQPPGAIAGPSVAVSTQSTENTNYPIETVKINKCITCERGLNCDFCKKEGSNNPFNIVAYDSDGKRFTMHDYINYKVTDKTLKNYFAKKRRMLNQICINDHRSKHGLAPIVFKKNRGKNRIRKKLYKK